MFGWYPQRVRRVLAGSLESTAILAVRSGGHCVFRGPCSNFRWFPQHVSGLSATNPDLQGETHQTSNVAASGFWGCMRQSSEQYPLRISEGSWTLAEDSRLRRGLPQQVLVSGRGNEGETGGLLNLPRNHQREGR